MNPLEPTSQPSPQYSCQVCRATFASTVEQRKHFKCEWHKLNLKRQLARLEPLSQDAFHHGAAISQEKMEKAAIESMRTFQCVCCKKSFASENSFENHVRSQRHKQLEAIYTQKQTAFVTHESRVSEIVCSDTWKRPGGGNRLKEESYWRNRFEQAETDHEIRNLVEEKISSGAKLCARDCLFCPTLSPSVNENLAHMSQQHSFFVPDREQVADMEGLLEYLADKVSLGNLCIFCNDKGKPMYSLEAARRHMILKGHCKISFDAEERKELADFYRSKHDDEEDVFDFWSYPFGTPKSSPISTARSGSAKSAKSAVPDSDYTISVASLTLKRQRVACLSAEREKQMQHRAYQSDHHNFRLSVGFRKQQREWIGD